MLIFGSSAHNLDAGCRSIDSVLANSIQNVDLNLLLL